MTRHSNSHPPDSFLQPEENPTSAQDRWSAETSSSVKSNPSSFSYPFSARLSNIPPLKSDNEDDDDSESGLISPATDPSFLSGVQIRESNGSIAGRLDFTDHSHTHATHRYSIPIIPRKSSKRAAPLSFHSNENDSRNSKRNSSAEPSLVVRPGSVHAIVQDIEASDSWG